MKVTEPKIDHRPEQPYIGIRTQVPMSDLPTTIPQLIDETEAWLLQQGEGLMGAPFIRYHIIDMDGLMDVEIGWPVDNPLKGDGRVSAGVLPAGRYAALIYTDVTQGIEGNGVLIDWAQDNGIAWDAWDTDAGHAFRSRIEHFLTGPADDPDPTNWQTEVAILVKD